MRWWLCAGAMMAAVWIGMLWPLLVLPCAALGARRWRRLCLMMAFAYGYGAWALHGGLQSRLPETLNGQTLTVEARVVGLPRTETVSRYGERLRHQSLELVLVLGADQARWPGLHRVKVSSWEPRPMLHPGDRVRARVRLYFPHGVYNETGRDWARVALARHIDARGVLEAVVSRHTGGVSLDRWRDRLAARLRRRLAGSPLGQAVIPALVVGDMRGIDRPLWALFRELGTAHLLAISGSHLTLISGLLWWCARWSLAPLVHGLMPVSRRLTMQQLAWLPALAGTVVYALLAGFEVPVQRALIMVSVVALGLWRRRRRATGTTLGVALVLVLALDPLAALSAGLWLSFTAVAMIVLLIQGGRWPVLLALPVAMAVLSAWLFGAWAWWSPLANLLLVPVFAALVPMALLGAVLDSAVLLEAAATGVELSAFLMAWLRTLPAPPLPMVVGAGGAWLLAALVLLLLPAWPWPRRLLLLWLLPWLLPDHAPPGPGQVDLTVFEVGQGQALALRTRHHLVLYDLGPAWRDGSAARQVLLPWLARYRIRPDVTIVSHGDRDHAGGLADLAEPGRLLSGEPDRVPGSRPCRAGQSWRFDGVTFRVVWPRDGRWRGNAASCVLRVQARGASVLLTGDITEQVEYRLLGEVAPVTVLQLAHHGSATANTRAWIEALRPRWAVASMGYANRFGHPHPDVVKRLDAAGVTLLRTDRTGMIVFRLGGLDNAALITNWRRDHGRPWHGPGRWRFW